ncbi:hypothetical protein F01_50133 [Burkholderia cenocepacia]|nr:hypothetical protein F01_50133 [Burkholderia cenocepacia]
MDGRCNGRRRRHLFRGAIAYPAVEIPHYTFEHVTRHLVHALKLESCHQTPVHDQFFNTRLRLKLKDFRADRASLTVTDVPLRVLSVVEMDADVSLRIAVLDIAAGNLPDLTTELLIHRFFSLQRLALPFQHCLFRSAPYRAFSPVASNQR